MSVVNKVMLKKKTGHARKSLLPSVKVFGDFVVVHLNFNVKSQPLLNIATEKLFQASRQM